jgi:hypothetical protein
MRLTHLVLLSLLAVPAAAADRPDFAGTWQLDIAQSNFGNQPPPDSMTLNVSRSKHKTLQISQTSTKPHDVRTVDTECRTDGNFHPVDGPVSGSVRCKWEGNTLISEKELPDGHSKLEIRLTISPDGGTATEQLHVTDSNGVGDSVLVWKRM